MIIPRPITSIKIAVKIKVNATLGFGIEDRFASKIEKSELLNYDNKI
jgi:hypothetical protein